MIYDKENNISDLTVQSIQPWEPVYNIIFHNDKGDVGEAYTF